MGYYQDLLAKIEMVEAEGFNPYTETYSARIGQLDAKPSENGLNVPKNGSIDDPTTTPVDIVGQFTKLGYGDPFKGIVSETGELDLSKISTGYNAVLMDKDLGVTGKEYIDYLNTNFRQPLEEYYGAGKSIVVNPDETLGVSRDGDKTFNYRFEKSPSQSGKGDIYFRWDEDSGDYITYDTEEEYDKARTAYKQAKLLEEQGRTTFEDIDAKNTLKKVKTK